MPDDTPERGFTLLALAPDRAAIAVEEAAADAGFGVTRVDDLQSYLRELRARSWTATLVSMSAAWIDEAVLARVADEPNGGALVLATPSMTLESALLSERLGAIGVLREPVVANELETLLRDATSTDDRIPLEPVEGEVEATDEPVLLGSSPEMARVLQTLVRAAASSATVLVTGESGTGKELVARTIHQASPRAKGPFVPVNCAAIPDPLLESELFGHERGAFTGAVARRVGRFARADGGTLFLDEIGDMSPVLQAKILRVLEERTVEPVGAEGSIEIDVRIVAATHRDLRERIDEGLFRDDLYHRLSVVELHLPPLRARGEDVRTLSTHFAATSAARHGRRVRAISLAAMDRLAEHDWPGNVRELRNVIERAVVLSRGEVIGVGDLRLGEAAPRLSARHRPAESMAYPVEMSLAEVEREHIRRVLDSTGGHMTRAAEALGIHRNTLTRKVRDYGLEDDPGRGS